jgi:hypothetical protein
MTPSVRSHSFQSHNYPQTLKCLRSDLHQDDYKGVVTGDLSLISRYSLPTLTERPQQEGEKTHKTEGPGMDDLLVTVWFEETLGMITTPTPYSLSHKVLGDTVTSRWAGVTITKFLPQLVCSICNTISFRCSESVRGILGLSGSIFGQKKLTEDTSRDIHLTHFASLFTRHSSIRSK